MTKSFKSFILFKGAQVILLSRSNEKMTATKKMILTAVPEAKITLIEMNLKSYKSVEKAAESLSKKVVKIDVLILNAGAIGLPFELIEGKIFKLSKIYIKFDSDIFCKILSGMHVLQVVNHFSHFLLVT